MLGNVQSGTLPFGIVRCSAVVLAATLSLGFFEFHKLRPVHPSNDTLERRIGRSSTQGGSTLATDGLGINPRIRSAAEAGTHFSLN